MSVDGARPRLVLWDIDQTLVEVGQATRRAYATVFNKVVGRPLEQPWHFNGRTELAAVTDVLRAHGVHPTPSLIDAFVTMIVDELRARADQMRHEGRVLAGAEDALRACKAVAGVHQSVLTGNLYPLASLKLSIFELADQVDLRVGAFGGDAVERTDLPPYAWRRAERHLGHGFTGLDTVIVGDTLLDVATGRAVGAHVVAVATGPAGVAELQAAGANVVLPDLSDTNAVVDAIVASSR